MQWMMQLLSAAGRAIMSPAALQQRQPLQQQNSSPQQKQQQGVVMQGRPGLSTQMSTPCSSRVWGMTSTSRT
jgi:hypothetical protein